MLTDDEAYRVVPIHMGVFRTKGGHWKDPNSVVPIHMGVFLGSRKVVAIPLKVVPIHMGVFRITGGSSSTIQTRCPHTHGGVP